MLRPRGVEGWGDFGLTHVESTPLRIQAAPEASIACNLPNFDALRDHVSESLDVLVSERLATPQMPEDSQDLAVAARRSSKKVHRFVPHRELCARCVFPA